MCVAAKHSQYASTLWQKIVLVCKQWCKNINEGLVQLMIMKMITMLMVVVVMNIVALVQGSHPSNIYTAKYHDSIKLRNMMMMLLRTMTSMMM